MRLTAILDLDGARVPALSFSESGLTLPADSVSDLSRLARGRRYSATLHLDADEHSDAYPVVVRLAARSHDVIEVALVEVPAQARLRLRHAGGLRARAELSEPRPSPVDVFPAARPGREGHPHRRLVMMVSEPVWEVTRGRRAAAERPAVSVSSDPDRSRAALWLQAATLVLAGSALIVALWTLLTNSW